MMKKFFGMSMIVCLLLSLFSCGGKDPGLQSKPTPEKEPETQSESTSEKELAPKTDPVVHTQESAADIYKVFSQETFTGTNGVTLPYRLYVPADYDAEKYVYPVLLFLHGAGERGNGAYGKELRKNC